MGMTSKCSVCEKPVHQWAPKDELPEAAYRHLWGGEWSYLCSYECYGLWWRGRMMFLTLRVLKKMDSQSFEAFQKIFDFSIAGGYAEEKYRKMRNSPFMFLCGLDESNLMKLGAQIEKI